MKNDSVGLMSRLDTDKERISEFQVVTTENSKSEKKKEEIKAKNK